MSEVVTEPTSTAAPERARALDLGLRLSELIDDPEAFVIVLEGGLLELSDPGIRETVERVSPGSDSQLAVRGPLIAATQRPLRKALRASSSASALYLAQRLAQSEHREIRLFALPCLERSMDDDPERSWQLMRQMGRRAEDWSEVDSLAELWAIGTLAEPFRWAELEQLIYSDLTMERRLVGACLARIPHRLPPPKRSSLRGALSAQAFELLRQLIGDAEPMVQKALSWATREWSRVDPSGATAFLREQTNIAIEQRDGNRAWVIRDSLALLSPELDHELRDRLDGVRRSQDAPSTSIAAMQAATFASAVKAHGTVSQQGDRFTRSRP